MGTRRTQAVAVAVAAFAVLAVSVGYGLHLGDQHRARYHLLWTYGVQWTAFAAAVWAARRLPGRWTVPLILAGGTLLQVVALCWPPQTTDDFYRYVWDGRVQAHGIDPYAYPPPAPELAGLRDGLLFPGGRPIFNHPTVPTIYPPVAQLYFLLGHVLGGGVKQLQVLAALSAVGAGLLIAATLRRYGADPRAAALWAWCPTVVLEAGNDAHVDVFGALLLAGGLFVLAAPVVSKARAAGAGALLGAAVGVKFLPALAGPALLRHPRRWLVGASAAALLAVSYLPHVLAVGPRVLGFLGGYLGEEQYSGAERYPLLGHLAGPLAPAAAVLVLAGTALAVARRSDPARPALGALVMAGVAFCVLTPEYPWYALLLVALAALADRARWLLVALAGWPAYLVDALGWDHDAARTYGYGAAAVLVVLTGLVRRRRPGSPDEGAAVRSEDAAVRVS